MFSISCKSKQDPTPSKEDLVGTWKSTYSGHEFILNIDSEGNLIFNCGLLAYEGNGFHYNFAGKLADTFEYPYTIELTFTLSSFTDSCKRIAYDSSYYKDLEKQQKTGTGTFTFRDASTCEASVDMVGIGDGAKWEQIRFSDTGAAHNRKNILNKQ